MKKNLQIKFVARYICPKFTQTSEFMTNRQDKYTDISAYGLLPYLRESVAAKRKSKDQPSRDTVWRAFNLPDEKLSALHKLIVKTGLELLEAHEVEIQAMQTA